MKKFKQNLIPLGVMVLGAVAAFASQAKKDIALAHEYGYINLVNPCDYSIDCDNVGTKTCSIMLNGTEYVARGKWSPGDVTCTKPLFEYNP